MKEIDANRKAWGLIAREHYEHYSRLLQEGKHELNAHIRRELGDIRGKRLIHLQCNTGADSILLARMGASVTGVDLVPDNIHYAQSMARELGLEDIRFIASDVLKLTQTHHEQYDIVFASEGVLGWLPDLRRWGETVRALLKSPGFLYVYDSHPFFMMFDEEKLGRDIYEIKYPYFDCAADLEETIGGYAARTKHGVEAWFWMQKVSDIINAAASNGLRIEYFHEFPECFWDSGGDMTLLADKGLYIYPHNKDKYPMSYSLKASL